MSVTALTAPASEASPASKAKPAKPGPKAQQRRHIALTAPLSRAKVAPLAPPIEEQPLDLALIGNCRIAALVDTSGRIVWWCFPRFDSNPVFSRLLSGDEEKGFADVVLADFAACRIRPMSQYRHRRDRARGRTWRACSHHRFRAAVCPFRAHLSAAAVRPPHHPVRRTAAHRDPRAPDSFLWPPTTSHSLGSNHIRYRNGGDDTASHDRRAAFLYLAGDDVSPSCGRSRLVLGRTSRFESALDSTAREFEERTRHYLAGRGCARSRCPSNGKAR